MDTRGNLKKNTRKYSLTDTRYVTL